MILKEFLVSEKIIKEEDITQQYRFQKLGGSGYSRDLNTLIQNYDSRIICSASCFIGNIFLLKGKINFFAFAFTRKEYTRGYHNNFKRLDIGEFYKLFSNIISDKNIYDESAYEVFEKTLLLQGIK